MSKFAQTAQEAALRHFTQRFSGYWTSQILGWASLSAMLLVSAIMYHPGVTTPLATVKLATVYGLGALSAIALSHLWRGFIKRRSWLAGGIHMPWWQLILTLVLLALLQTIIVTLAFFIFQPFGALKGWAWFPPAFIFWIMAYTGWTTIYAFKISSRRAKRLELEALQLAIHAKDAELRALQAQINPHFFFNSLNSIRALIFENPVAAAYIINQLSELMRYTLNSSNLELVTLAQELQMVDTYLSIEKVRFEQRLRLSMDIETGLEHWPIPPMTLQTLVENAIKYGVERHPVGSEVRICVQRTDSGIRIVVANPGKLAITNDTVTLNNTTGLGLENTRRRLVLLAGDQAAVDLVEENGWVIATMRLPQTT